MFLLHYNIAFFFLPFGLVLVDDDSEFLIWTAWCQCNAIDHTGQTALHWSAVRGHVQVAELLLKEGAKVNAADLYGYQVCSLIFLLHPWHFPLSLYLLSV